MSYQVAGGGECVVGVRERLGRSFVAWGMCVVRSVVRVWCRGVFGDKSGGERRRDG